MSPVFSQYRNNQIDTFCNCSLLLKTRKETHTCMHMHTCLQQNQKHLHPTGYLSIHVPRDILGSRCLNLISSNWEGEEFIFHWWKLTWVMKNCQAPFNLHEAKWAKKTVARASTRCYLWVKGILSPSHVISLEELLVIFLSEAKKHFIEMRHFSAEFSLSNSPVSNKHSAEHSKRICALLHTLETQLKGTATVFHIHTDDRWW